MKAGRSLTTSKSWMTVSCGRERLEWWKWIADFSLLATENSLEMSPASIHRTEGGGSPDYAFGADKRRSLCASFLEGMAACDDLSRGELLEGNRLLIPGRGRSRSFKPLKSIDANAVLPYEEILFLTSTYECQVCPLTYLTDENVAIVFPWSPLATNSSRGSGKLTQVDLRTESCEKLDSSELKGRKLGSICKTVNKKEERSVSTAWLCLGPNRLWLRSS